MNKTENTAANKARFFSLYYGQEVFRWSGTNLLSERLDGDYIDSISEGKYKHSCLSIRSIDSLTDEEIKPIANYYGWTSDNTQFNERLLQFKIDLPCICDKNYAHRHMPFVYDYLRSIGILIPYMDLSVETIKEWGWAVTE